MFWKILNIPSLQRFVSEYAGMLKTYLCGDGSFQLISKFFHNLPDFPLQLSTSVESFVENSNNHADTKLYFSLERLVLNFSP